MTEVRKTKRADELSAGDWTISLGKQRDFDGLGRAEILFAHPYTDDVGNARVYVVAAEVGYSGPQSARLSADETVRILTEGEMRAAREEAERTKQIADIRVLADWLEANPWLPIPDLDVNRHLYGPDGYRTVVELAGRLGAKLDTHLDDRTKFRFERGPLAYTLLAWHDKGRPAEPAPEPADLGASFDSSQVADSDATPLPSSRRYEPHNGGMTDSGLVDETPTACTCDVDPLACVAHGPSARASLAVSNRARGLVDETEDERCPDCGESLREIALGTLGHIPGEACAPVEPVEHREVSGWKGEGDGTGTCGVECACGVTYDNFDSLAEAGELLKVHIEAATSPIEAEPVVPHACGPDCECRADEPDGTVIGRAAVDEPDPCYVPNGFQAPEVIAERVAACAASHPGTPCRSAAE
jgi:hypothetical protein